MTGAEAIELVRRGLPVQCEAVEWLKVRSELSAYGHSLLARRQYKEHYGIHNQIMELDKTFNYVEGKPFEPGKSAPITGFFRPGDNVVFAESDDKAKLVAMFGEGPFTVSKVTLIKDPRALAYTQSVKLSEAKDHYSFDSQSLVAWKGIYG